VYKISHKKSEKSHMERPETERDEYTGIKELKKIMNFLKNNDYTHIDEYPSTDTDNYNVVDFEKKISYTDKDGNKIGDSHIKILIEYDQEYDVNHRKEDFIYNLIYEKINNIQPKPEEKFVKKQKHRPKKERTF
jgi:hypothetical protein